jgi:ribosome-associated toxin RatA of RatAB toxin-antitoxin module
MMLHALTLLTISQLDMGPMLERGPMVLVEEGTGGKFAQASAIVVVDAAPEKVWELVKAQQNFKDFIPKVLVSEMKPSGTDFEVHLVIDVPGPDTDYVVRYTIDDATKTMTGCWAKGDLKASRWFWKIEAAPGGKTLLTHTAGLKNFSAIAQSLEDDNQTVTVGVNVSSVLAATKAVKKKAESVK